VSTTLGEDGQDLLILSAVDEGLEDGPGCLALTSITVNVSSIRYKRSRRHSSLP
jgi:hypothetical protein